jgi:hypothetical protein
MLRFRSNALLLIFEFYLPISLFSPCKVHIVETKLKANVNVSYVENVYLVECVKIRNGIAPSDRS